MKVLHKESIVPDDGKHYFFGYYDLQPFARNKHLAHRVPFADRHPKQGERAELGYIDIPTKTFVKLAETEAWNFQQGGMLQWFEQGKSILFNDFQDGEFISRIVDTSGKEIDCLPMPIAALSRDKKYALSINFARIFDFRKGYGYLNKKDPFFHEKSPKNDGVHLLNLQTKERKLLVSYAELAEKFKEEPFTSQKLLVNHITFSPSGKKYVMLVRNFTETGKWGTVLAVGDLGGEVKQLTRFEVNSHYSWKDDETLMIYSGLPDWGVYFFNVDSGAYDKLNDTLCDRDDIHCNYSPDRSCFIGDGYPDANSERTIYHYDFQTKKSKKLLSVYSQPVSDIDVRCDLHARWREDGNAISYDTTENGRREIVVLTVGKD